MGEARDKAKDEEEETSGRFLTVETGVIEEEAALNMGATLLNEG